MTNKSETKAKPSKLLNHVQLSESDIALVDAVGILFDLVVAGRDPVARKLDKALQIRARHWMKVSKPNAAAILTLLRKRSTDPGTLARRRTAAALLTATPKGRA